MLSRHTHVWSYQLLHFQKTCELSPKENWLFLPQKPSGNISSVTDRHWRAPLSSMLEYWRCWSCASSHSCCNFITATILLIQKANCVFENHSWPLAFTFLRYYLHSSEIFPEPWRQIYTRDDSFSTHQHISRSVSSCASCAIFCDIVSHYSQFS